MKNIFLIAVGAGITYLLLSKSKSKLPPINIPDTSSPDTNPNNSDIAGIRSRMYKRKINTI